MGGRDLRRIAPDAEGVGHAIDGTEPGGDQSDLEDTLVVEADGSKSVEIGGSDSGRVFGQLNDVVEHGPILNRDRSLGVLMTQRMDEIVVQNGPTQKLRVGFDSVAALVG